MLLSLFVVCQAEPWTEPFVVKFEQDKDYPCQSFSIKHAPCRLPGGPSDTVHKKGYARPASPPDDKRQRPGDYGIKTTTIEPTSWQWLYSTHLLVAYELVLTIKDARPDSVPYSCLLLTSSSS
ncbi:hypothetical protein [Endozoicomonas sp. 8E]|uniref:hypothetical protein n=1 Tax=Endozoicomonas sp. 8E TaxID=3035692 RepID=UPI0029390EB7|nr:hypothetical protein [Endozoicomonas sp. 8E]WOG27027.1 hypothetical protein P6910_21115 [Endozoicomonas sp. 8E]